MRTLNSLTDLNDEQRQVADELCEAAKALARVANGIRGDVMPAPTAYDLLGNLKVALAYLAEVTRFMPVGVRNSLSDERIRVYDSDFGSGRKRDPAGQVTIAGHHLAELLTHLVAANEAAEAAQVVLNGQGYMAPSEAARR